MSARRSRLLAAITALLVSLAVGVPVVGAGDGHAEVTRFGAAGDGVADDQPAIQAAVDSVRTGGGTVYFPPGTYRLARPVSVEKSRRIRLTGAGAASILRLTGDIPALLLTGSVDAEVDHLAFAGTFPAAPPTQQAIVFNTGSPAASGVRVSVHHCVFQDLGGGVFIGQAADQVWVTHNAFHGTLAAIQQGSGSTVPVRRLIVTDNFIVNAGDSVADDAIALTSPSEDVIIARNVVDRQRAPTGNAPGITRILVGANGLTDVRRVVVSGNIVRNNAWARWRTATPTQQGSIVVASGRASRIASVLIEGNVVTHGMSGIAIEGDTSEVIVSGNVVEAMQAHGIWVGGGNGLRANLHLDIRGNQVHGVGGFGIMVANAEGARIDANVVRGARAGGIQLAASPHATVRNNSVADGEGSGIAVRGDDVTISANEVRNTRGPALDIRGARRPRVRHNDVAARDGASGLTVTEVLRGGATFAGRGTVQVRLGATQPDSLYSVTLGCNANETVWITDKGVGGFTLNSANEHSTAHCEWHLLR